MAYENRFDGKADHYLAARPSYSPELTDFLYSAMGFTSSSVIADVGCGTGKFTKQLLDKGSLVYGIEPNESMGEKAMLTLDGYDRFHLIKGNDAFTGIKDHSVDFVTAAQSFHWFDPMKFRNECLRIMKPGGRVFLIWNLRDYVFPVNREWNTLFREFAADFIGFNNGLVKDDPRIKDFFQDNYAYREFENRLQFDQETFRKRLLSSSLAPMRGDVRYEEFLNRVDAIFLKYQKDGIITVPHYTAVYYGRL